MELRRLTATEARLATLVADGRSDAEIAAGLVLAPGAVAEMLSAVCAKLGVRSRTELALLLGRAAIVTGRRAEAGSRRKR
jgi:DNA-binding NarL/FixJ family response regulator